jgi:serine/threonine protein kinase
MPAPKSVAEFLTLVKESGLLPSDRVDSFIEQARSQFDLPKDPVILAKLMIRDGLLTKFQAQQLLMGRHRNFNIAGKYRVLERLGTGGMASVFLCEHLVMRRHVALKILPVAMASDPEIVGRFHRESRAVAQLKHPNIVGAHDVDVFGKVHFLVTEYVDGGDLEVIVRKNGPLDPLQAAHYIKQAAAGLQHAHEAGMVHRDIKPGNLLLDRNGTVKLLDLGLALIFKDGVEDGLSQGGDGKRMLGTLDYLAPEQAVDSHGVDIRADIYSLGATFYFLLAGRAVFEGASVAQKLAWHQFLNPEPIESMRSDVPAELLAIIDVMMAKELEDRYQTPAEVVEALAPWTEEAIDPPSPSIFPAISPAARVVGQESSLSRSGRTPMPAARTPVPVTSASMSTMKSGARVAKPAGVSTLVRSRITGSKPGPSTMLGRITSRKIRDKTGLTMNRGLAIAGIALLVVATFGIGAWLLPVKSTTALGSNGVPISEDTGGGRGYDSNPSLTGTAPAKSSRRPTPASGNERAPDVVITLSSDPANTRKFPTIQEAIRAAKLDDRIQVRGTTIQEVLELEGDSWGGKDVTVEGIHPSGGLVTWLPPGSPSDGKSIIALTGAEKLKLKGFLIDGRSRIDDLVSIAGRSKGLSLENVHLRGALRAGIVLKGCTGEKDRPVTFKEVRFTTEQEVEAAVLFGPAPAGVNPACENILLDSCRFEGPYQAALTLACPTSNVEIRHSRFFLVTDGLRYKRAEPANAIGVRLVGNTMYGVHRGLHFETTPRSGQAKIEAKNNIFAKTPRIAVLDRITTQPAKPKGRWIWFEEKKSGNNSVPPEERQFRKTFDLATVPASVTLDISCDETFTVWLNGVEVGKSPLPYYTQRVFAFDVTKMLRPGRNVLAVQGKNELDSLYPSFGTAAALFAQMTSHQKGAESILVSSDETWKASDLAAEGWQRPDFDDRAWTAPRLWSDSTITWPWSNPVWDSVVLGQLQSPLAPIRMTCSGNLRDYTTWDGYPSLESKRVAIKDTDLPRDPANNGTFLRYPEACPLSHASPEGTAVGLPEGS